MPLDPACYFWHRDIVDLREESIPLFAKQLKNTVKERVYDHANSVFKDWIPDDAKAVDQMLKHDFTYWKVPRFVKDANEQESCKFIIKQNIAQLMKVWHYLRCKSLFPGVGFLDFVAWVNSIKLVDEKCSMNTIERTFIAANVELEKIEGNANNSDRLMRFQFLEVIVRLAKAKFIETGVEKSFSSATARLIREHIKKYDVPEDWQGFRDAELWTIQINDIMEPNIPGLRHIYESYFEPRKRFMSRDDALYLFTKQTNLIVQE